ncbi:MAG: peptide/nickel transport system substrate-binding protein, partial [Ilumatobacteraceae bacterium]
MGRGTSRDETGGPGLRRHSGAQRWTRVVALGLVAVVIAASCGSDKKSTSGSAAPTGTQPTAATQAGGTSAPAAPANGRELVIDRDMDLTTLDLSLTYCDTCQIFNTAVYETLITVDPADPNKLLPRLATSWEANDDNTVFTFKLDAAAKFDDGSAVESKDVKFSWERLANMKGSASYLMAGLKSIDTPDAGTVVVTFSAPNSAFLPIVAASYLGIMNSDV